MSFSRNFIQETNQIEYAIDRIDCPGPGPYCAISAIASRSQPTRLPRRPQAAKLRLEWRNLKMISCCAAIRKTLLTLVTLAPASVFPTLFSVGQAEVPSILSASARGADFRAASQRTILLVIMAIAICRSLLISSPTRTATRCCMTSRMQTWWRTTCFWRARQYDSLRACFTKSQKALASRRSRQTWAPQRAATVF